MLVLTRRDGESIVLAPGTTWEAWVDFRKITHDGINFRVIHYGMDFAVSSGVLYPGQQLSIFTASGHETFMIALDCRNGRASIGFIAPESIRILRPELAKRMGIHVVRKRRIVHG